MVAGGSYISVSGFGGSRVHTKHSVLDKAVLEYLSRAPEPSEQHPTRLGESLRVLERASTDKSYTLHYKPHVPPRCLAREHTPSVLQPSLSETASCRSQHWLPFAISGGRRERKPIKKIVSIHTACNMSTGSPRHFVSSVQLLDSSSKSSPWNMSNRHRALAFALQARFLAIGHAGRPRSEVPTQDRGSEGCIGRWYQDGHHMRRFVYTVQTITRRSLLHPGFFPRVTTKLHNSASRAVTARARWNRPSTTAMCWSV
jgi:hypothetical protein